MAFHAFGKQGSQVLREIGIIEGVFNVFPFPEPRIKLHVDQCTGDRAVAEPLLYLEQVGTGLVVVKRMSMPEGVETVSPFIPAQFMQTVFEHLLESAFADMGTRPLAWEKPVIRFCTAAALLPVLPEDVPEPYRKLNFSGVTALAHFFRDRDRAVGKRDITETKCSDFGEPERCAVGNGKFSLMFQVLCIKDQMHDIFFRRDFREWVVHLAQREIIIREGPSENKAEILFQGTVIDVDRSRCIAKTSVFFTAFEVQKK